MAFIFLLFIQFRLTNNPELTLIHSPITTEGKRAEEFRTTYAYDNHLTSVDIERPSFYIRASKSFEEYYLSHIKSTNEKTPMVTK